MIKTPKGMDVRPSGARLREAFFNILREVIPGCIFYDMFADRAQWDWKRSAAVRNALCLSSRRVRRWIASRKMWNC